ncbi:FeoB-associated Cys-rich membrane protein [Odoribacter laneus]|uniref:FeoB-associated Cys-rich membrane protein n=1 Tax=Odoribacter laneus TaxID=626933 RepID=UPI0011CB45D5|nr:FeoB-associated Cys-rich membrane protein [Odoribacter sp.]
MQQICVYIILIWAIIWVVWRNIRLWKKRNNSSSCQGCAGCPLKDKCNKPEKKN